MQFAKTFVIPSTSQILWMPLTIAHVLAFDESLMISGLKTPKSKTSPPAAFAHSRTPIRPIIYRAICLAHLHHLFSSRLGQFSREADFKLHPRVQEPNAGKTKLEMAPCDASENTSIFSASGRFGSWEKRAAFECSRKENQDGSERRLVEQSPEEGMRQDEGKRSVPKHHYLDTF